MVEATAKEVAIGLHNALNTVMESLLSLKIHDWDVVVVERPIVREPRDIIDALSTLRPSTAPVALIIGDKDTVSYFRGALLNHPAFVSLGNVPLWSDSDEQRNSSSQSQGGGI